MTTDYDLDKANATKKQALIEEALAILGLTGGQRYEDWNVRNYFPSEYQELWARTRHNKKPDQITIRVSENSKKMQDVYVSRAKDGLESFEINVSMNKTAEQIAKEIKRRILDTEQFKKNEEYLKDQIARHHRHQNAEEQNRYFFQAGTGLVFMDNGDKTKASKWQDRGTHGYLSIKAEISSKIEYCELTLRGLSASEWAHVFEVIKPLIEGSEE